MNFIEACSNLEKEPKAWCVTGVAGFIGSNLLEALLNLNQYVIGLDNFSTGHMRNLEQVKALLEPEKWQRFSFVEGDIRDLETCRRVCQGVDFVLHQAALGSVPLSIEDPLTTNAVNVCGFVNMLVAAKDEGVDRFIYASSSATYGDEPSLPKVEVNVAKPLSPYAVSKYVDEIYAINFSHLYGLKSIGLRYFNVFGRRQDPKGAYAAVIPKWIAAMLEREAVTIFGDGETSRDFCHIDNVVQANILAALAIDPSAVNQVYNVGVGEKTSLNELFELLRLTLKKIRPDIAVSEPVYQNFRVGDIRHSYADISKARSLLGYSPTLNVADGLMESMEWYVDQKVRSHRVA